MATYTADMILPLTYSSAPFDSPTTITKFTASTSMRYKLRASCSSSPTGYVQWVNSTGDDTGRPGCGGTLGPTVLIASWVVDTD